MAYGGSTAYVKIVPVFDWASMNEAMLNVRWKLLAFEVWHADRMAAKRIAALAEEHGAVLH